MSAVPLILSIAAFVLLGLSTDAHHRRRFGYYPAKARRYRLRSIGCFALAAAFIPAIIARGWVFGPILWAAAVMAGAAVAFLALNLLADTATRS